MKDSGDYISREALKELFDGIYDCADLVFEPDDQICAKQHSSCGSCRWIETKRAIQKRVMSIPAADVRPVVRGKWINDHNGKYSASGDNFYCSICKDPSLRAFGKPAKTNYCPNCGAEMRIFSTNCENTVTTGEDREISNLRAWLKNGQENKTK